VSTPSTSFQNVIVDADPWLRRMRLPHYALSQFRQMKLHDEFLLVDFEGPGISSANPGVAAVTLSRDRGGIFHIEVGWLMHLGAKTQKRGHLWWDAEFKLLPGRRLELLAAHGRRPNADARDPVKDMRMVALVMRRAALLARWACLAGDRRAGAAMHPQFFDGRMEREVEAADWLENLTGPGQHRPKGRAPLKGDVIEALHKRQSDARPAA
jgi:hypothetical protein